jgi:hypothetical protein
MISTDTTTFWHIPKTAGESVEQWFRDNNIKADIKQYGARKHETPRADRPYNHTWWAVVRNPYDRIASMYRYKINKDGANGRFTKEYPTFQKWCLTKNMDQLVDTAATQWTWAEKCNLLIRFENLEEEFEQVMDLYGCFKSLPVVNSSKHRKDIDTTYTTEMREAVYKKFEQDFIQLGYNK